LTGRKNVLVKNMNIEAFSYGIDLSASSRNTLDGNHVSNCGFGVILENSLYNDINENSLTNNLGWGIGGRYWGGFSGDNVITGNTVAHNGRGIVLDSDNTVGQNTMIANELGGICLLGRNNNVSANTFLNDGLVVGCSSGNRVVNNLVNCRPLVYLENVSNYVIADAGQIILINCEYIKAENLNLSHTTVGIQVFGTNDTEIIRNDITDDLLEGVDLSNSSRNRVKENNISATLCGISLHSSPRSSIDENNITDSYYGVELDSSSDNSVSGNRFVEDGLVVGRDSYRNSVKDNSVNGSPLVYLEGVKNYNVSDAGQVILVGCDNIRVENLNLVRTDVGVQLRQTNNSIVSSNSIKASIGGISAYYCIGNIVRGNTMIDCHFGMSLDHCCGNIIDQTIVSNVISHGVRLDYCSNNSLSGNTIRAYAGGSWGGIWLFFCCGNSINGNTILDSIRGIWLDHCSNDKIYHNSLINNTQQVRLDYWSATVWDDGYPSGGNYWNDYAGVDAYHGSSQDLAGSDGIGDTPYIIDSNNTDRYPLMNTVYLIPGDLNNDGKVSLQDLAILAEAYSSKLGDTNWNSNADIDSNNAVGLSDLVILAQHYGQHYP
jgi:parallel beta-helix repeat protein